MRSPFIRDILKRLAPQLGANVRIHPDGFVGTITFPSGAYSLFWDNKFNLNPVSSAKVAQDKFYTSFVLKGAGVRVPEERLFFRPSAARYAGDSRCGVQKAYRYAKRLGLPVYLKPNRLSQGRFVEKVHSYTEFRSAAAKIWEAGRGMLVQRPVPGRDYRIILLDGEVLSAYERRPLAVTGDGRATIGRLLRRLQEQFDRDERDTVIDTDDPRLHQLLKRKGHGIHTILPRGEQLQLMDAANLSLGGTTLDVTTALHPSYIAVASRVAQVMDLRFCGIDVLAKDATRPDDECVVLEVNSAPGLDNYLYRGRQNTEYVDGLYLKVLEAIARGHVRSP